MSEKKIIKPLALAVGVALAGTFAISGTVNADSIDSPFEMSNLTVGYMLGEGEGSCGGDKDAEGSCGEKMQDNTKHFTTELNMVKGIGRHQENMS